MRVLVIGGTGFIGTHVVRQLVHREHTVAVYHRGRTEAALPKQVRDIRDPFSVIPIEKFSTELFAFEPEVVVHTMAMGAADAGAFAIAFADKTERLVLLSSGDVYRAYGRLTGVEPGPVETGVLSEDAPLRTVLFPYRERATSPESLEYWYEKILAEEAVLKNPGLTSVVLRLPKVYGPGSNEDLATVYRHRHQPNWRWTHGYVANVAAAIALAATHPLNVSSIYNVGEACTPTIAERLASMPPSTIEPNYDSHFDFSQDIAYDTSRIRKELGYRETVPEDEALLKTLATRPQ